MSRIARQDFLVNKVAAIAVTFGGLAAGYLLGSVFSLQLATNWLDRYAKLTAAQDDASFSEARGVLNTIQGSPYANCSDAEIAYFRGLVSHSEHVRDAGRMSGGRIECSAFGRPARSLVQLKPSTHQQDGTLIYSDFPSPLGTELKSTALQLGTAYVAFASNLPDSQGPIPMHVATTLKEAAVNPLAGPLPSESQMDKAMKWTADSKARLGDMLYATRCSTLNSNCVTAFTSVSEASHSEIRVIIASTAAGGLMGVFVGMGLSFLFRRNRDLGQQLRRAVFRDQLQVVYQPIVVLSTRQIVGAEALARWTDEEGNTVDPEVFVKIAEENGFVGALTKSVLRRALRDLGKTLQSRPGFRLSVNVSGADLVDPEFLSMLNEALHEAQVRPQSVVIEISEKATSKSEIAMETIRNLRRMGHSIHIDDFGTGYSNLDKLLYLFADTIKIDKAFTGVIGTESVAVAILPQILAMAKSLNLEVIVEGVETDHQANYFSPIPPQVYGQGWLYGRPVSIKEFEELLVSNMATALAAVAHAAKLPASQEADSEWTTKPGKLQILGTRVA
ncbi:MAG: EAL domain-containing protein [Terracidiphilus sp.]